MQAADERQEDQWNSDSYIHTQQNERKFRCAAELLSGQSFPHSITLQKDAERPRAFRMLRPLQK
jgi:hypothetical protein